MIVFTLFKPCSPIIPPSDPNLPLAFTPNDLPAFGSTDTVALVVTPVPDAEVLDRLVDFELLDGDVGRLNAIGRVTGQFGG